jgi:hypothetical protein
MLDSPHTSAPMLMRGNAADVWGERGRYGFGGGGSSLHSGIEFGRSERDYSFIVLTASDDDTHTHAIQCGGQQVEAKKERAYRMGES